MAGEYDAYLVIGTFIAAGATLFGAWYYPRKQHRTSALLEVFKLLNREEARTYRMHLYRDHYHRLRNIDYLRPLDLDVMSATVRADFDQIGSLVREGLIPKTPLLRAYWATIILSWNALSDNIQQERQKRQSPSYMTNFEDLYGLAEKYKRKHHNDEPVKPYPGT